MLASIINKSLTFNEGPLSGKSFHPLWMRERVSNQRNLDQNNFQRLYESSLLDQNISIKSFSQDDVFIIENVKVEGKINTNFLRDKYRNQ